MPLWAGRPLHQRVESCHQGDIITDKTGHLPQTPGMRPAAYSPKWLWVEVARPYLKV